MNFLAKADILFVAGLAALCVRTDLAAAPQSFTFRVVADEDVPENVVVDFRLAGTAEETAALIKAIESGPEAYRKHLAEGSSARLLEPVLSVAVARPTVERELEMDPFRGFHATTHSEFPAFILKPVVTTEGSRTVVTAKVLAGRWITVHGENRTDAPAVIAIEYEGLAGIAAADSFFHLGVGITEGRFRAPRLPITMTHREGLDPFATLRFRIDSDMEKGLELDFSRSSNSFEIDCRNCTEPIAETATQRLVVRSCGEIESESPLSPSWAMTTVRITDPRTGRNERKLLNGSPLRLSGPRLSAEAAWRFEAPLHQPEPQTTGTLVHGAAGGPLEMLIPFTGITVQDIPLSFTGAVTTPDGEPIPAVRRIEKGVTRSQFHLLVPCNFKGVVRFSTSGGQEGGDLEIDTTAGSREFDFSKAMRFSPTR